MFIRVTAVEVCDARDDDSSTVVRLRSLLVNKKRKLTQVGAIFYF